MVSVVTREVTERLIQHLKKNVPGIRNFFTEWPDASMQLQYPSITLLTKNPTHQSFNPYIYTQGATNARTNYRAAECLYVTGQYEFPLQLDLWTKTKEDRHTYYDLLYKALVPDPAKTGFRLTLENYHDAPANYLLQGFRYDDQETTSQRTEWRVIVDLIADCKAIVRKEEFVILETELTLEVTERTVPGTEEE